MSRMNAKKTVLAIAAISECMTGCMTTHFANPTPKDVPELMTAFSGEMIASVEQWEKVRAPELLEEFTREEYGRRPVERPATLAFESAEPDKVMMDGKAVRKRVHITYSGPYGGGSFTFTAFIPRSEKPSPAFLLICNRNPVENIDPERVNKSGFWPAEEIVARGYAAIAFWNGDVAPDRNTGNTLGVFAAQGRFLGHAFRMGMGRKPRHGLDRVGADARRKACRRRWTFPRRQDGTRGRCL